MSRFFKKKSEGILETALIENRRGDFDSPNVGNVGEHEEGYAYDFVIVVPNPKHKDRIAENFTPKIELEEIVERLRLGGLLLYVYKSADQEEFIIKVKVPLKRLKEHAENIEMDVRVDYKYLDDVVDIGKNKIAHDSSISEIFPYEFIYANYKQALRLKLMMSIIKSNARDCCGLNLPILKEEKSVLCYFPLHNSMERESLRRQWLGIFVPPWRQPIDQIRDYFGEKIGLYFQFLSHYTHWLGFLAVGGIITSIDIAIEAAYFNNLNTALLSGYLIPFFCIFVSVWAQLLIEYWKRCEKTKAMEWGTTDFEEEEEDRPDFYGQKMRSIINGEEEKYFSESKRFRLMMTSVGVIVPVILVVIGIVSVVFYSQISIHRDVSNPSQASSYSTLVSILNAVQIQVLNYLYTGLADYLTRKENHRTDTSFEDSLIAKLFAFNFINSYASLFYVAFIKSNIGDTCQISCMDELTFNLGIIFVTRLFISKSVQFISLFVFRKMKLANEKKERDEAAQSGQLLHSGPLSAAENEFMLEEYDSVMGTITMYSDLFIQYGYVTLFVAAFPLAPFLAYFSNWVEIKSSGNQLLFMYQRAFPTGAEDIGTWLSILQITAIIAVITNAALICFTMKLLTFEPQGRVWIFIVFQYVIFLSMYIFSEIVSDVPTEVSIQLSRMSHLRELMFGANGDDSEDLAGLNGRQIEKTVQIHDRDEEC